MGPAHLQAHLRRLEEAAGRALPWLYEVEPELRRWAGNRPSALRLALDLEADRLWARREPLPETRLPYRLLPLPHPLPPSESARHKGMDGPWSMEILVRVQAEGADDALLYWPDGTVAESAIATVAVELDGTLILAPPGGRVVGLGERLLLPSWAEARGLRLETRPLGLQAVADATLWCVNALRGVWRAELHPAGGVAESLRDALA